jgi:hypothetical protein
MSVDALRLTLDRVYDYVIASGAATPPAGDTSGFVSDLSDLQQQDPTGFKETMTARYLDFRAAAASATDPASTAALMELAGEFQDAKDAANPVASLTNVLRYVAAVATPPAPPPAGGGTSGNGDGDTTTISDSARVLATLNDLKGSDPAKYKEATTALYLAARDDADPVTDPNDKAALMALAGAFQDAKDSGDLSGVTLPADGTALMARFASVLDAALA